MIAVRESVQLTIQDLQSAVLQLTKPEFINFGKWFWKLQNQQNIQLFEDEEEKELLDIIYNAKLKPVAQGRLDILREKLRDEIITEEDHQEFCKLTERVEQQNVVRVRAMGRLSIKRGITIQEVAEELDLESHDVRYRR
ncbi:MAG: hypothetical protein AAF639_12620 [Chloroflexota bacterium]